MPVIFAPVVLRTFPDRCTSTMPNWIQRARHEATAPPILKAYGNALTRYRDGSMSYIKLLDGGLVDNYGLSGFTIARLSASTLYAPLTAREAANVRRLLFLVVDGGKGPTGDWARLQKVPLLRRLSGLPLIRQSIRASVLVIRPLIARCLSGATHWFIGGALFRWRSSINMAYQMDRVAGT